MSVLKANVENFVPKALQRDLRRLIRERRERGSTHLQIMVPFEDFDPMIREISAQCLRPYVPLLFDVPIVPWEKEGIAVVARPDAGQRHPVVFMLDGQEYDYSYVITPASESQILRPPSSPTGGP